MIECPICGVGGIYRLRLLKLMGSRTGRYSPLYFCRKCRTILQRPNYHEDDMALQSDLQWHINQRVTCGNHVRMILSELAKFAPEARTLLDIGCGIGTSILISEELGFSAQGIEPNPYAVRYAGEHFSLRLTQDYFRANIFKTKFDVIMADNVLEHVPAPRAFMRDVFATLNPGGFFYLAVPERNGGLLRVIYSLLFPTSRRSIFTDNDVHINHFSRTSILRLIEPYGATLRRELFPGAFLIQAES